MSDACGEVGWKEIEGCVECEDIRIVSGLEETGSDHIDDTLGPVISLKPIMDDCCSCSERIEAQGHIRIIA